MTPNDYGGVTLLSVNQITNGAMVRGNMLTLMTYQQTSLRKTHRAENMISKECSQILQDAPWGTRMPHQIKSSGKEAFMGYGHEMERGNSGRMIRLKGCIEGLDIKCYKNTNFL